MSWSGVDQPQVIGVDAFNTLRIAAKDRSPISGLTHRFYRYPARFSPTFASTAIGLLSDPGDLVLDPYMGGGTTVVEALAGERDVVGNDINSLSVFVTRVKTTLLTRPEQLALAGWADTVVPKLSYWDSPHDLNSLLGDRRTYNLTLPRARAAKKIIALALRTLETLPSEAARDFARCALLNVGQLFLNGRRRSFSVTEFRERLQNAVHDMLDAIRELGTAVPANADPILLHASAADLLNHAPFNFGRRARLVVTSPPYPGIHMLYHRWQVDGRHETPAPYWLANCQDGQGNAYYNFADRTETAEEKYFAESLRTLKGIRAVMADDGIMAQLVAFASPSRHLRRYLRNMETAGFQEIRFGNHYRVWRDVPSRRWHANFKGKLRSAREVLLLHRAV